jgi:hypothetical protein
MNKEDNFVRNNYYYGKLMTVRDYFDEQCYFNEKRWLINRAVHGWGVVCGLEVYESESEGKVCVSPGLAIDCCGREILVCKPKEVELIPTEDKCQGNGDPAEEEKEFYIGLEFWDCKTEGVEIAPAACGEAEKCEFNRIQDYFEIRVLRPSEVIVDYPLGLCPLTEKEAKDLPRYICEKMMQSSPECPELPRNHAVILAKVTLDDTGDVNIEHCPYRSQVYSNKTLFDLINCYHGDLPHVIAVNWERAEEINGVTIGWEDYKEGIYDKGVKVKFDRKMKEETINTNTFLFLVKMKVEEGGNYIYEQVPGVVTYVYEESTGESTATFKYTPEWIHDVYFGYSRIPEESSDFMVVLKGDFILSEVGKALDGNFIGGNLPSGNGTQGGDFVSWFSVEPKPKEEKIIE